MNEHGHTCFHQPSPTYQENGIKWKKLEVKHSCGMNSEKISLKISTFPQNEKLVETAKQIKEFIQPTENKPLKDNQQTRS